MIVDVSLGRDCVVVHVVLKSRASKAVTCYVQGLFRPRSGLCLSTIEAAGVL